MNLMKLILVFSSREKIGEGIEDIRVSRVIKTIADMEFVNV